jgi:hypothetical protein
MVKLKLSVNYNLLLEASEGKDNINRGCVGSSGFGFRFIDKKEAKSLLLLATSQLRCLRDPQEFIRDIESSNKNISDYLLKSEREAIKLAGAVKTLAPSVEYGGFELLFEVFVLTRTPENHFFPLIFYYGASGLALGGFNIDSWEDRETLGIPFNYNPFKYNDQDLEALAEALHLALLKIPTSDFYGVYKHDFGNTLMGLKGESVISLEIKNIEPSFVKYAYDFLG